MHKFTRKVRTMRQSVALLGALLLALVDEIRGTSISLASSTMSSSVSPPTSSSAMSLANTNTSSGASTSMPTALPINPSVDILANIRNIASTQAQAIVAGANKVPGPLLTILNTILESQCGADIAALLPGNGLSSNVTFFAPSNYAFSRFRGLVDTTPAELANCQYRSGGAAFASSFSTSGSTGTSSSTSTSSFTGEASSSAIADRCAALFDLVAEAGEEAINFTDLVPCLPLLLEYHIAQQGIKLNSLTTGSANGAGAMSSGSALGVFQAASSNVMTPALTASAENLSSPPTLPLNKIQILESFLNDTALVNLASAASQSTETGSSSSSTTSASTMATGGAGFVARIFQALGGNTATTSTSATMAGGVSSSSSSSASSSSGLATITSIPTSGNYQVLLVNTKSQTTGAGGMSAILQQGSSTRKNNRNIQQETSPFYIDAGYLKHPPIVIATDLTSSNGSFNVVDRLIFPPPRLPAALRSLDQTYFLNLILSAASTTSSATSSLTSASTTFTVAPGQIAPSVSKVGTSEATILPSSLSRPGITIFVPSDRAIRDCYGVGNARTSINIEDFIVTGVFVLGGPEGINLVSSASGAGSNNAITSGQSSNTQSASTESSYSTQATPTVISNNTPISVAYDAASDRVDVNGAPVIAPNVLISNGIVHVIDAVFPWVSCPSNLSATMTSQATSNANGAFFVRRR